MKNTSPIFLWLYNAKFVVSLLIFITVTGIIAFIFGFWDNRPVYAIGIIFSSIISIMLVIWLSMACYMPWAYKRVDCYTPVLVTFENGNKIQLIQVGDEIINLTVIFGLIIPEDKIIKKVIYEE